jgi:heme O synthase-like polyprenyltransferase
MFAIISVDAAAWALATATHPITHRQGADVSSRGAVEARRSLYAVATVAASGASLTGDVGVYLAVAAAMGAVFIWLSWRQLRVATTKAAMGLFRYSLTYLGAIFVAMMLDQFVRF